MRDGPRHAASTRASRAGMSGSPSRRADPADAAGAVEQGGALEPALRQAVAVGVDQALRIGPVAGGGDEVLRRGAQRDEAVAVVDGTDADGTGGSVAGAAGQRDARRQAEFGGDGRAERGSRQRAFDDARHLRRGQAGGRQDLGRPGAGGLVEPERARRRRRGR